MCHFPIPHAVSLLGLTSISFSIPSCLLCFQTNNHSHFKFLVQRFQFRNPGKENKYGMTQIYGIYCRENTSAKLTFYPLTSRTSDFFLFPFTPFLSTLLSPRRWVQSEETGEYSLRFGIFLFQLLGKGWPTTSCLTKSPKTDMRNAYAIMWLLSFKSFFKLKYS